MSTEDLMNIFGLSKKIFSISYNKIVSQLIVYELKLNLDDPYHEHEKEIIHKWIIIVINEK